jgi:hypothetical protein
MMPPLLAQLDAANEIAARTAHGGDGALIYILTLGLIVSVLANGYLARLVIARSDKATEARVAELKEVNTASERLRGGADALKEFGEMENTHVEEMKATRTAMEYAASAFERGTAALERVTGIANDPPRTRTLTPAVPPSRIR